MTPLGKTCRRALLAAVATTTLTGTVLAGSSVSALAAERPSPDQQRRAAVQGDGYPLVIGHRGASGYRPEHTLEAYRVAIRQGADYVEPDLVSTKDGVLVARHENYIDGTTDVEERPEFADRKRTKVIDGATITGFFTEDFTLAELKTLRAEERLPVVRPDNTQYDGRFEVPTFEEVLALVKRESNRGNKQIGVYPETKHPTYFDSIGLSLEEPLLASLKKAGLDRAGSRVFLQSFETANLRELDTRTDLPIVQLMDASGAPADLKAAGDPRTYKDLATAAGLREIATYADGVGPNKELVLPRNADGFVTEPSAFVADAHAADLLVHVFTLRRENQFMAKNFRIGTDPNAVGDLAAETRAFFDAGIDGAFTDNPDIVVKTRQKYVAGNRAA